MQTIFIKILILLKKKKRHFTKNSFTKGYNTYLLTKQNLYKIEYTKCALIKVPITKSTLFNKKKSENYPYTKFVK